MARVRPHRERNEDGGEANGGGGRGRGRGRRGGGGGGGGDGEGGQVDENGDEEDGGEGGGRGRRVPPVAENSVYIKGFPDTTSEEDIRAEVCTVCDLDSWLFPVLLLFCFWRRVA